MKNPRICVVGFGVLAAAAMMVTAGPLNPPAGPVASTYKTLNEVEPRVPVQSLPGDSTALYVINQPGSYYLAGNVTGVSGKNGIRILASDVVLDLRGFVLDGAGVGADAIHAEGSLTNLSLRDGTIRSWSGGAVSAGTVTSASCTRLLLRNCASGLNLGQGATVESCIGADMSGNAVSATQDSRASRCVVMRTGGIVQGSQGLTNLARRCVVGASGGLNGGLALECTVRNGAGITCWSAEDCTSTGNSATGIWVLGLARGCTSSHNTGDGFVGNPVSCTSECVATSNTGHGIRAAGFNMVRECASVGNSGAGAFAINVQNVLERNMLSSNGGGAVNATNGYYGAILSNFLGPGGGIVSPAQQQGYIGQITTPPANFVSTDPWMNIAY